MKRAENLTENKGLINTFKKLKTKIHLNKSSFKNSSFYLFKYNKLLFLRTKLISNSININCVFFKKTPSTGLDQKKNYPNLNKHLIRKLLMFIN